MTLIETLIGAAIGSAVIGAMVFGAVSFQQLANGADEYYKATSDQMRVLDSIALDTRRATSGSVSNSGQTLTLNLPDYIDYSQNPPVPRTPTISAGTVSYGTAGSQPTVVYTITGTVPNQTITRTLTSSAGVATTSILTWDTSNNQFLCFDPANPASTNPFTFGNAGEPSSIMAQVTFQPRFNRINLSSSRAGTTAAMRMYLRNHK